MSDSTFHPNPTIIKANEIFLRASRNFEEIQSYLEKFKNETNKDLKDSFLHHLMNLIRIQELLIQSHTRLTSVELKIFNLTGTINAIGERTSQRFGLDEQNQ